MDTICTLRLSSKAFTTKFIYMYMFITIFYHARKQSLKKNAPKHFWCKKNLSTSNIALCLKTGYIVKLYDFSVFSLL